ncbi:MAG: hypothetical protein KBD78_09145 [Oligoflexales bacterium]|nr:hypothetical protein [Oligoflexales bacterium]
MLNKTQKNKICNFYYLFFTFILTTSCGYKPQNLSNSYLASKQGFELPELIPLSNSDDPVTRNQKINENYATISAHLNLYLGYPQKPNWYTYAHHASHLAGQQLRALQATKAIFLRFKKTLSSNISIKNKIEHLRAIHNDLNILSKDKKILYLVKNLTNYKFLEFLSTIKPNNLSLNLVLNKIKVELSEALKSIDTLYTELGNGNHSVYLATSSAYLQFMRAQAVEDFSGKVQFDIDINDLGTSSFYNYYLAAHTAEAEEKNESIFNANIFLGFLEQSRLQKHFDLMKRSFRELAGFLSIEDPLGSYPLTKENWAEFSVRMAVEPKELEQRGGYLALSSRNFPSIKFELTGTIPRYFYDRFYTNEASLMFEKQALLRPINRYERLQ